MITATSEAIIFAIHSAIRLSANLRKAYANSLKSKALVLPLPKFDGSLKVTTAEEFFDGKGASFVQKIAHLKELHQIAGIGFEANEKEKEAAYLEYYRTCWQVLNGDLGEISADDLTACFQIRQWEQGKGPKIKPFQIIAGTLVNIGIDYFNQIPGALNPNSAAGKFLKSFLVGIENVDFSGDDDFKKTLVKSIVPKLFVASAETLNQLSDKIGDDKRFQDFVKNVSGGMVDYMQTAIAQMNTADSEGKEEVMHWGRLIFKSLIKNAGDYVFNNPHDAIGTGIAESALIKKVGNTLMSILLEEDPNAKIQFKKVLTVESLDKIVKSSLSIVAEYPQLLAGNKDDLKLIVKGVASSLAVSGINRPGLLPDVVRLVLVNVTGNLDRLTKVDSGKPAHLLVTALQDVLTAIAPKPGDLKWRPSLSNADILSIVEDVFDEVIANPQWIESKTNKNSLLGQVICTTYDALAKIPEGDRLNGKTLRLLIMLGMRTAANNAQVLGEIPWPDDANKVVVLNKTLDLIFSFTFEKKSIVDKVSLMYDLTDYIFKTIIEKHPNAHGLVLAQLVLEAQSNVITQSGLNKTTANLLVQSALTVINEHPDLITNNNAFQSIISGVTLAWSKMNINQPHLLGELIRVTLVNTAGNLDLLIPSTVGQSKHLAVVALEDILTQLSQNVPTGKWKPKLTNGDLLQLVNNLLDEVVQNPNWITQKVADKPLFSQILTANFDALRNIPANQRLSGLVVQTLLDLSLRTAASNSKVLGLIKWGDGNTESTILNKGLDVIFAFVFKDSSAGDKSTLLIELTDYLLNTILSKHPNEVGLTLILNILSDDLGVILTAGGLDKVTAQDLINTALDAIAEHPELVSKKVGIANIVSNTAMELRDSKLGIADMLPEFIRLILEKTAGNLDLLIDSRKRKQKMVLILALQQILKALSSRPASGKWKPTLTGAQILHITSNIFDYIIQNPQWIKNEMVADLLKIILKAVENVPSQKPLPYEVLDILIKRAFKAANFRKQLIVNMIDSTNNTQQLAIAYSLDGLFIALYDESGGEIGSWTLTQGPVITSIIDVFLLRVSGQAVTKAELDAALAVVKKAIQDLNENKAFLLETFLRELGEGTIA